MNPMLVIPITAAIPMICFIGLPLGLLDLLSAGLCL